MKFNFFLPFIFTLILLGSCDDMMNVGLGEEVDMIGPELAILSHSNLDFVSSSLTLSGSCSDNKAVTRVEVKILSSGITVSARLTTDSKNWEAELALPAGQQTLEITAYDARGNTGVKSVKTITLRVDENAASITPGSLFVSNSTGTQVQLKDQTFLEACDNRLFTEIGYFQNEYFTILGSTTDNFIIESVEMILDVDGIAVYSASIAFDGTASPGATGDVYNWYFKVSESDLLGADPAYASGRHYLNVSFNVTDKAGNVFNTNPGSVLWYPESDVPQILHDYGSEINSKKNENIQIDVLDDDEIASVYSTQVDSTAAEPIRTALAAGDYVSAKLLMNTDISAGVDKFNSINIDSGSTSGKFYLFVLAEDADAETSYLELPLFVLDEDAPIIEISSPAENTVPSLTGGRKFIINGNVHDNSDVVTLRAANIPYSVIASKGMTEARNLAEQGLVGLTSGRDADGIQYKDITLQAKVAHASYNSRDFSVEYDILDDFTVSGILENAEKNLVFFFEDDGGNRVFKGFRLKADLAKPELASIQPANLTSHEPDLDLTVSFEAVKSNNLAIAKMEIYELPNTATSLASNTNANSLSYSVAAGTYSEGDTVDFLLYAEDILGNSTSYQTQIAISAKPVLQKISTSFADMTYKIGDVLRFQAEFSKPVAVTGTPKLILEFTPSLTREIEYNSGSETDTLYFEYTVQAGDTTTRISSAGMPISTATGSIHLIEDNTAEAIYDDLSLIALQDSHTIGIDGKAPVITAFSSDSTDASLKEGSEVEFVLQFDEPMSVIDFPQLVLESGAVVAAYSSLANENVYFKYTVQAGDDIDGISINNSCFIPADILRVTDKADNPVDMSAALSFTESLKIDTTAPDIPVISPASGNYSTDQTVSFSGVEADATVMYSKNDGISYQVYDPAGSNTLVADGSIYKLKAYQIDKAGNASTVSASTEITTYDFPAITYVGCDMPDGVYNEGDVLTLKLVFERAVAYSGSGLVMSTTGLGSASVLTSGSNTEHSFELTIPAGVATAAIEIADIDLSDFTDGYGVSGSGTTASKLARPGLIVDSTLPTVTLLTPIHEGSSPGTTPGYDPASPTLTLTFSEDITVDTGNITIRPYGNWRVPAVMSSEEFMSVFNSANIDDADRTILMQNDRGIPLRDTNTGQVIGPYAPVTYGLIDAGGGNYVPDLTSCYVLNYSASMDDASLRGVFNKAEYGWRVIDITSGLVSISSNVMTINLTSYPLLEGLSYEVLIDGTAIKDGYGNAFAGYTSGEWVFTHKVIAEPVIRLDLHSFDARIEGQTEAKIQAAASINVKIESQTPGVTFSTDIYSNVTMDTPHADHSVATSAVSLSLGGTSYTAADKFYIHTTASKSAYTAADAREGAFKTVVAQMNPNSSNIAEYTYLYVMGSTTAGGVPVVSGFPLKDSSLDPTAAKQMYNSGSGYYWVSYEIRCDFAATFAWFVQNASSTDWDTSDNQYGSYASNPEYEPGSYGDLISPPTQEFYNGSNP